MNHVNFPRLPSQCGCDPPVVVPIGILAAEESVWNADTSEAQGRDQAADPEKWSRERSAIDRQLMTAPDQPLDLVICNSPDPRGTEAIGKTVQNSQGDR